MRRARRAFLTSASVAALTALSTGSASAQANWTGATSSDWTNGANWSTGTAPIAGNTVIINTTSPNPTVLGVGGPAVGTTGQIFVGNTTGSFGNLTIQNGSTLTSSGASLVIGVAGGSNGTVTVTGAGSQWITSGSQINLGASGNGTLNIQNGAAVVAQSGISLGTFAGGTGTLNINGGSTLETNNLSRVAAGTGQVNFDNAILRARINNNFFISGFTPGSLNIAAGGLTVDTQAFTVAAGAGFSGVGGLTKIGAGTLNLRTSNDYTGPTVIQAGTLALASSGSIAASSRVVVDATFNVSGITAAGTSIQSLAGSGAVALGAKNLTITNANDVFSGTLSGTGALTLTGGMQTLSGNNAGFGGSTTVQGGTLAVNGILAGPMSVLSAGRLQGIGTVGDTTNAGIIAPGNSIGTLTIAGNYTGNGGTLQIESVLGGDASPTDRLVVTGNTAGSTTVRVINLGGSGAQTVEGIKVVDVGGASTGTFALQGDYVFHGQQAVVGGAYAYTLQKNGIAIPADGDWYLRSALINPPPQVPAGPLYQPGVPLYESYGQVLLGLARLPTMQQRVGSRYWGGEDAMMVTRTAAASASASTAAGDVLPDSQPLFWGRVEGRHGRFNPATTTGSRYDSDQVVMQSGLDGLLIENNNGRLIAGLNGQYGNVSARVRSVYGDGKIDVDGYSFGGTLTWYGHEGFYVDSQAQVTWLNSKLTSDIAGTVANGNGGLAHAFSVEGGKRFAIGGAWSVTPQAQLSYASVSADFEDRFGTRVTLDDAKSLLGRLGLSADYRNAWRDPNGQVTRTSVYGITNLHYEFLDGTVANVAGTTFANANERQWGGVGLGGTYNWANDRYALYGEVSVNTGLKDFGDSYSLNGTAGFRLRW